MHVNHIFIESFQKQEGIIKHAQYVIKGHLGQNTINISRRFKEFAYLRKTLIFNWPACVVPQIPPKQMIGNLDTNFLERRKALLNRFLQQLVDKKYFAESEEFTRFLFQHSDYLKVEFRFETYIEIAEKYHKIFNKSITSTPDAQTTENIQNFLNFCSIFIPAFEKFEKICISAGNSLQIYQNSSDIFIDSLKTISAGLLEIIEIQEVKVPDRAEIINPFEELLFWARGEILDTRAMIEAIQKLLSLPDRKAEYSKQLEKKKKKYENLKQGKTDVKDAIFRNSKGKQKQNLEFYELEAEGLKTIESISLAKLMNLDLPSFKELKTTSLSHAVKVFSGLMQSELGKIKHQSSFIRIR